MQKVVYNVTKYKRDDFTKISGVPTYYTMAANQERLAF